MSSIAEIVEQHVESASARTMLTTHLVAREDEMADRLRVAAIQFGLFPEIVAEVLADVEMGSPLTAEHRALIHTNFHTLMTRLQAEQGDTN